MKSASSRKPQRKPAPGDALCAIDFGTSNSAVAVPAAAGGVRLIELEAGMPTMPTAVFYFTDPAAPRCAFGRAAMTAYIDGHEGRLMRSMKSILGSTLVNQSTEVGAGRAVPYLDVISGYLSHLRAAAETAIGMPIASAVLGRPVFFVDDHAARDAQAQASLEAAAHAAGLHEVTFQYEPIAAAFDYEQQATREHCVLVADLGGGTSDFSLVRVGPDRIARQDRRDDILASHGVHVAGTDFDRRIELASLLPPLGYGAFGPVRSDAPARAVPSAVYFDLATWHLINTVYRPARVAELKSMANFYADPDHHRRLMRAVNARLGHDLAARAEAAKLQIAAGTDAHIDLELVESGLSVRLHQQGAMEAIEDDIVRIIVAARETVRLAGVRADAVDAIYFTGGSSGLKALTTRLSAAFPTTRAVQGDRLGSVATGLGLQAARRVAAA